MPVQPQICVQIDAQALNSGKLLLVVRASRLLVEHLVFSGVIYVDERHVFHWYHLISPVPLAVRL